MKINDDIIKIINDVVWWIPFKKLRNNVRGIIFYLIDKLYSLEEVVNKTNNYLDYVDNDINNNISKLNNDIKLFNKIIPPYIDGDFNIIVNIRKSILEDINFFEKYNKLIKNLDEKSCNIISNIFSKITNYNDINDDIIFSPSEEKLFMNEYYKHISKIVKFHNCYLYNNKYILSDNLFEMQIFHEEYNFEYYVKDISYLKDKSIIDVGAFIGDSSIVLSKYTDNKVYAFEPIEYNYNIMLNTINLNNIKNVEPIRMALGNMDRFIYFNKMNQLVFLTPDNFTESNDMEKDIIKMSTLDKFVHDNNINVGLIKTDLEGFEQTFLEGALDTIKKHRPILMISIYHNYNDFFDIKPMIEELNLGYKFYIYKSNYKYVIVDTMLIAIPEQTRPDQTRPDQTRPDQTRPNILYSDCIYIFIIIQKLKNYNLHCNTNLQRRFFVA